jgi:glc operon protein GlcG
MRTSTASSSSIFLAAAVLLSGMTLHARGQDKAGPLVTRARVQLNLAGADIVLEAAQRKSAEMGLKCNIAIVDDGGHLLTFARMDGARPASGFTAMTKAVSAATFRQATGTLPANGEPDMLLSLSLQNAAAAGGGKITTLKGGVPIMVDNQVIGAVGVGGGTGEQDAEIAKAGIQALLDRLTETK